MHIHGSMRGHRGLKRAVFSRLKKSCAKLLSGMSFFSKHEVLQQVCAKYVLRLDFWEPSTARACSPVMRENFTLSVHEDRSIVHDTCFVLV
jgi:hypothetical protein